MWFLLSVIKEPGKTGVLIESVDTLVNLRDLAAIPRMETSANKHIFSLYPHFTTENSQCKRQETRMNVPDEYGTSWHNVTISMVYNTRRNLPEKQTNKKHKISTNPRYHSLTGYQTIVVHVASFFLNWIIICFRYISISSRHIDDLFHNFTSAYNHNPLTHYVLTKSIVISANDYKCLISKTNIHISIPSVQ